MGEGTELIQTIIKTLTCPPFAKSDFKRDTSWYIAKYLNIDRAFNSTHFDADAGLLIWWVGNDQV